MPRKKQSHWASITCPFFCESDYKSRSISCEGKLDGTHIKITFNNNNSLFAWQNKYCKSIGANKECQIYQLANLKYDTD